MEIGKSDKKKITVGRKPRNPQAQNVEVEDGRDTFETPNYATDLLVPFIPENVKLVWECATGNDKIANRLKEHGYGVIGTDIRMTLYYGIFNFLTEDLSVLKEIYGIENEIDAIITNPPFSLKQKFYKKCLEYRVPFALLIPADYSGWLISAVRDDGAEKIIPSRRIDYITPTGKSGATGHTSYFHSMWLTWGFGLGKSETFVDLLLSEKKENI